MGVGAGAYNQPRCVARAGGDRGLALQILGARTEVFAGKYPLRARKCSFPAASKATRSRAVPATPKTAAMAARAFGADPHPQRPSGVTKYRVRGDIQPLVDRHSALLLDIAGHRCLVLLDGCRVRMTYIANSPNFISGCAVTSDRCGETSQLSFSDFGPFHAVFSPLRMDG